VARQISKKSSDNTRKSISLKANQKQLSLIDSDEHLDASFLQAWLWEAVRSIRGSNDAPKFKYFILFLFFYKWLSDVFEEEFATYVEEFGDETLTDKIIEADYQDALACNRTPIMRFYIPRRYRWSGLCEHPVHGLGTFVTDAMHAVIDSNPTLRDILNIRDYYEHQGSVRTLDEDRLANLIYILGRHSLGTKNVDTVHLGEAFEYLLRKFAEGQGRSAGEFYTPKEVSQLLAELINARPYSTVYDGACGNGGFLIGARQIFDKYYPQEKNKAPKLYGQDANPTTATIAKMNLFLHGYTNIHITYGDTLRDPRFIEKQGSNQKFDYVISDLPWKQNNYNGAFYEHDGWRRFNFGIPPQSTADWGWIQHCFASLNVHGRAAIVLDTGAVSRGSGSGSFTRECDIRKAFVEDDIIEAVILLPENLFYNTSEPGILLLLNRNKKSEHRKQILLIDASSYFFKRRPKNQLTEDGITAILSTYHNWQTQLGISRIITIEEARDAEYNLHPSQFIQSHNEVQVRTLGSELRMLRQRAHLSEKDLADFIESSLPLLQALEADNYIPNSAILRELIQAYLLRNAFTERGEQEEAEKLWKLARDVGMKALFDEKWFKELLVKKDQQAIKPPITIFCCYSRKDETYFNDLELHLNLLRRQDLVSEYHYRQIGPGTHIDITPDPYLTKASLILFLISPDFLASDYIYSKEVQYALEKHKAQEVNVLPIILQPTDWEATQLANLQVLPRDAKPVTLRESREEAFLDIAKDIRRVCEDLRNIVFSNEQYLTLGNRSTLSHQQPTVQLGDVFVQSGVPQITFVKIEDFELLRLSLEEPGRGVVIEGPSGIGKTTAVQMAIAEIHKQKVNSTELLILSARNKEDHEKIQTLVEWHKGTVIIDDFHKLNPILREELSDYLKYLADTKPLSKKLVIVGIPQTGSRLVEMAHDIATRIEVFKLGPVKDELIQEMIEKGEKALNITFDRKSEIVLAANGSLNIAQFLCYYICHKGITCTQEQHQLLRCNVDEAVNRVINLLFRKFGGIINYLAGMGEPTDSTVIMLLEELVNSEDSIISLRNLKERRPSLARGIDHLLKERWIDKLYREYADSVNYLFFDQNAQNLVIEDPQLTFYLKKLRWFSLSKKVGKIPRLAQRKVFIGYHQIDAQWLDRLKIHLKPVDRKGTIELWDETKIMAGARWKDEILEAVCTSRVAIVLLSADFIASDFIAEHILPRLLSRAANGGTTILLLPISPCLLDDSGLEAFKPIPTPDNKPLKALEEVDQEQVLVNVAKIVQSILEKDNI
jgi:type I restriction enzyme M protein